MKIVRQILRLLPVLLLLYLLIRTFNNPHKDNFKSIDSFVYGEGRATAENRSAITEQLEKFQNGYTKRDTASVDSFMQQLFSRQNTVILGTMPNEIYIGFDEAAELVYYDWASWGDCKFLIDKARISVYNEVAWFATIGFVEFDLSKYLVLPLRLSGVLVEEAGVWKFQQLQFQFDLDISFNLACILLLFIWLGVVIVRLTLLLIRKLRSNAVERT